MSHHTPSSVQMDPSTDPEETAADWLLRTLPEQAQARILALWQRKLTAMLPLGEGLSAVRIPSAPLRALTGQPETPSAAIDEYLARVLEGGPVICDPASLHYYVIVPSGLPAAWHRAAAAWREVGIIYQGEGSWMGAPGPARDVLDPDTYSLYWAVPLADPPMPCDPLAVARLGDDLYRAVTHREPPR
ncbi:hypothetical protein PYK79_11135 [Streptomyces sp. ID05-04B]|uniref:hypothetical protein n=1 Tax=unclassified Streptomyces TaxID=2593676 RepID=UPI000D19B50C|nr:MULTISPECIES: hypothetical protein [unclassified Streptomyces]AVV46479.1 hypothetical protein C6376_39085 [Streptomyces sp. P3]AVV46840.1 hypothetical protein C6376_41490 [Streptomyces sp. P3]MDX5563807.1 hypothetical protein [Streptomyces sp. ID05-04B]